MTLIASLRAATLGLMLLSGLSLATMAQETPVEALGVLGPIDFGGDSYALSWTSHPTPDYFKQEYLPQGQQSDSYTAMFMIDALTSAQTTQAAAAGQIAWLEQRKATDPMVMHSPVHDEGGDVYIEFTLSDTSGPTAIVEWNAYRYTKLGDGIALYAISRRGYGDGIKAFWAQVDEMRIANLTALTELDLPPITLAK